MGDSDARSRLLSPIEAAFLRRAEVVVATPPVHHPAKVDTTPSGVKIIKCAKCRGTGKALPLKDHRPDRGHTCSRCERPCNLCGGAGTAEKQEVDPVAKRNARRAVGIEVGEEDRRW